jgi:hypothetical protein
LVTTTATAPRSRLELAGLALAPIVAGLVTFGLTRSTMLPGLGFWDTGEFQAVAATLGTAHPTGYPTYILLGWLASLLLSPAGEPAARLNVLSGLLLAVGAGLTVWVVHQLSGRLLPALAAGVLLALTPIAWEIGSFADPHMLHLVMVAALLGLLAGWERRQRAAEPTADRWLLAASAVYGLSLGNHQLTLLLAPGIALFLLATDREVFRRRALVARCAGAILGVAALVYLELPIRAAMGAPIVYGRPDTPFGFLYVALGVQFSGNAGGLLADLPGKAVNLGVRTVGQFGVLALFVPAAFIAVALRRPRIALLTATWVGVTCFFAASYENAMIERYYLGPILCVVVWLGAGAGIVVDAVLLLRRVPVDRPAAEPELGAGAGERGPNGPDHPERPDRRADGFPTRLAFMASVLLLMPAVWAAPAAFAVADRHLDTDAGAWSRWAVATVGPNAVLVTWWSYSTPLWYRQAVLGERPDITIIDDRTRLDRNLGEVEDVIRTNLPARPVYLVREDDELTDLATRWQLVEVPDPAGLQSLWRVLGRAGSAGATVGG